MDPYVGEIKMFGGNFAPVGWMFCDGSLVPISQFEVLFTLIGTTYGGDGQTTFALPDLRGRVPLHRSDSIPVGQAGGAESVTLTPDQVAQHNHTFNATTALGDQPTATGNTPGQSTTAQVFIERPPSQPFAAQALLPAVGGGQPHDNMHPYLAINYIIASEGLYPPHI